MDWNAVGAIGQWAGAVATFSAVVVALRAMYLTSAVRVKVSSAPAVTDLGGGPVHFVRLKAVNLSPGVVTVDDVGLIHPESGDRLVFPPEIRGQLPARLHQFEHVTVDIGMEAFAQKLVEWGCTRPCTLKLFFGDSMGNRHWGRLRFNPEGWMRRR